MVLNALVKYWCILHYHKCKVEYIKLEVVRVILIRVVKRKKIINIVLKNEMTQLF